MDGVVIRTCARPLNGWIFCRRSFAYSDGTGRRPKFDLRLFDNFLADGANPLLARPRGAAAARIKFFDSLRNRRLMNVHIRVRRGKSVEIESGRRALNWKPRAMEKQTGCCQQLKRTPGAELWGAPAQAPAAIRSARVDFSQTP